MVLVLAIALISPFSVSAKTKAGAKPGSFFYFFDKAIEKTSLFFIFNPEKKAKKALEHAEERLAEAEELKKEKEEKEIIEIKKEETEEVETSEKEIEKSDNKLEEGLEEEKNEQVEIKNNQKEESNKKDEQSKEIEKLEQNKEFQPKKIDQSSEIEKLQKEIEDLKKQQLSSVPAQIPTTLTTPTNATAKQNDVNLRDSVVSLYAEQAEKIKLFIESTDMTDYITELKYRRDKLVRRVNFIKNNMYFTDINETTNAFNRVIDAYIQEHEKEIKYINENLTYINYQIALLERYRTEYNKKISSLLANTEKFVTVEEYISANQHEIDVGLDEVYDPQSNIYTALRNHYKTVQKQEDVYASGATGIENILLKMGESTRVSTSYYQPMPQTVPPVIEFPKTTHCTVGNSGLAGELVVTCNETSF